MSRFALLILICIIIWGFWMIWEWLRNKSEPVETDLERDAREYLEYKNKLKQERKDEEQVALAKAKVAAAQGDYDAGVLNAKTQDLLSQPKMLEKQRIDNERIMWTGYAKTGKSPFGENNIFGGSSNSTPMLMLQR